MCSGFPVSPSSRSSPRTGCWFFARHARPGGVAGFPLVDDIATTRSDRLWIGQNHTEFNSWLAVLLIGFMTYLAVASVHLDWLRAGTLALALLTATMTIAYWSLGVVNDPYRHLNRLDPMSWVG